MKCLKYTLQLLLLYSFIETATAQNQDLELVGKINFLDNASNVKNKNLQVYILSPDSCYQRVIMNSADTFYYYVPYNSDYTFLFFRNGYETKSINVNTFIPEGTVVDSNGYQFPFILDLYELKKNEEDVEIKEFVHYDAASDYFVVAPAR